jgi:NADH dehydrogenase/NADH:ubiquinone oxidoreductase subunit G
VRGVRRVRENLPGVRDRRQRKKLRREKNFVLGMRRVYRRLSRRRDFASEEGNAMIRVGIDGKFIEAERGATILDTARKIGADIPTLCHHEGLPPDGNCRLCTVEITERGRKKLVASCMYPIKTEMTVETKSPRVIAARKFIIQLLVNRNPKAVKIHQLAEEYGVAREERFAYDADLCIRCCRCVRACAINGNGAIDMARTGTARYVASPFDEPPERCVGCAACAEVCPTGKITYADEDATRTIWGKKFDLAVCERCGERYATGEHIAQARLGAGEIIEEAAESFLCGRCRKAVFAARFKQGRSTR